MASTDLVRAAETLYAETILKVRDQSLDPRIARFERTIGDLFVRQGRELLAILARKRTLFEEGEREDAIDDAASKAFLSTETAMQRAAIEAIAATFFEATQNTGILLGVTDAFNLPFPRAEAFANARSAALVTGLNTTTRARLKVLVEQAIANGWSYDRLAKEIRMQFDGFAGKAPQKHIRSRAHLVAVTELGQAYEAGSFAGAKLLQDAGVPVEKYWLTVGDDRSADGVCDSNQSAGWIPLEDPFPSGHTHPLGHPACRCTQLSRKAVREVAKAA